MPKYRRIEYVKAPSFDANQFMPTYVYECSSCNDRFEIEQRISENPLDTCQCGSTGTVKRIIQPVGIMFKGSGFHVNDYSADSAGKSEEKAQPAAETKVDCTGSPDSCACSQPSDTSSS
jgi:putative FmdB family regulatory protein